MKLIVDNIQTTSEIAIKMAQFDAPIDETTKTFLQERGFSDAKTRAVGCMTWIWQQWLLETPCSVISKRVESFVDRGMDMQHISAKFHMRPMHDLYLLHCA